MIDVSAKSIGFMLISAFFFTLLNTAARYVIHLPTFELVFFRAFGTVVCCLFILKRNRIPLLGNNKKFLIIRAIAGLTSLALFFKSMTYIPVGTAVSLRYLSPIFAAGLGIFILKEKVKPIQWVFFAMAFAGVIMLKGVDARVSMIGLSLIIACAMFSGLAYVMIRKMGNTEHPIVIIFYFLAMATIVGGFMSLFNWVQPEGKEWIILFSMGIFGFFAQLYMTKAMQIEVASKIVPFKYAEAIMTILIGWLIFAEHQTWLTIIAIMIILAALMANVSVKKS